MGLFGGGNKQSQSTRVEDISSGANVGGDTTAPVTATSLTLGSGTKSSIKDSSFNFLDAGAIGQSFDFAKGESQRAFTLAEKLATDASANYNTARADLNNAFQQSVSAISAAKEPAEEGVQKQVVYMAAGLLLLVGFIFYTMGKK